MCNIVPKYKKYNIIAYIFYKIIFYGMVLDTFLK